MPNTNRKNLTASAVSLSLALFSAVTMTQAPSQGAGVTGVEQRARVTEMARQIVWYDNYNQALTCARQRGKPLVWIHMLGQMQGAT